MTIRQGRLSTESWSFCFCWIIDMDGAVFSLVKCCNILPLCILKKLHKPFWRGQGHRRTVILELLCWLKDVETEKCLRKHRRMRRRGIKGRRRKWCRRRRRRVGGRRRRRNDDCSYPTRYPEWQPGNKGSIKAALGGPSREQAHGLSSAPSWACYATLPWTPPPISLWGLPSPFHVFFFHFTCLSVSQS